MENTSRLPIKACRNTHGTWCTTWSTSGESSRWKSCMRCNRRGCGSLRGESTVRLNCCFGPARTFAQRLSPSWMRLSVKRQSTIRGLQPTVVMVFCHGMALLYPSHLQCFKFLAARPHLPSCLMLSALRPLELASCSPVFPATRLNVSN